MLHSDRIKTRRLWLRPFEQGDLDDLYAYAKLPDVGPNAGWKPHDNIEESRGILQGFIARRGEIWAIASREDKAVIGSIGLHPDSKRTNPNCRAMGYVLHPDYWGQGLMTEAARAMMHYGFCQLCLDLISIYRYEHNERSKRVIEKCKFRYEGTQQKASMLFDGSVYDDVCYSMSMEEYYTIYCRKD